MHFSWRRVTLHIYVTPGVRLLSRRWICRSCTNVGRGSRGSCNAAPINNWASRTKGWYLNLMLHRGLSPSSALLRFSPYPPSRSTFYVRSPFCYPVDSTLVSLVLRYINPFQQSVHPLHRGSGTDGDENGSLHAITAPPQDPPAQLAYFPLTFDVALDQVNRLPSTGDGLLSNSLWINDPFGWNSTWKRTERNESELAFSAESVLWCRHGSLCFRQWVSERRVIRYYFFNFRTKCN